MFSKLLSVFAEKPTEAPPVKEPKPPDKPKDMILGEIGFDNSNLYSAGDFQKYDPDSLRVNKGYDVYEKMMLDDQVKAVLEFKKHAIASRSWRFDVASEFDEELGKEVENEEQKKIANFFETMVDEIKDSWSDNLLTILSALEYGYSICEKNYKPIQFNDKTYWGIRDIKLRPYETFDGGITIDQHGNIKSIEQIAGGESAELPQDKIIHFVHQKTKDSHYGESDLKAAYRSWWAKDVIIKLENLYLERLAGGFLYAEVDGNLTTEQKATVKALINNVSGKMGAMLPKKVQLKLFPAVQTEAFIKAIALQDKAIAKSVLVPNLLGLTEQGNTGSYAQSEVHKEMFFFIILTIAKRLEEALNEQIFKQLALWNFNTDKFPRFKFDDLSNEQKELLTKNWADLVSKGAVTKSDSDEQHVRNLMNFPDKTEKEEEDSPGMEGQPPPIPPGPNGEPVPKNVAAIPGTPDGSDKAGVEAPLPPAANNKKKFAEKGWMDRVNYVEVKKKLDNKEKSFGRSLADVMGQVKESLYKQISTIVGQRSLGNVKLNEFKALAIPRKLIIGTKTIMKSNLQEIVDFSIKEAASELPTVPTKLAESHAIPIFNKDGGFFVAAEKLIGPGMDTTQIVRFLKEKSDFFVTGVLEPDVLNRTLQLLQNGILYDKSLRQMMIDIEKDSKLLEVLPATDAGGRAVNVPARLENIVRTNTSGALNMGRTNLFNREEYKGFIEAFEYSAILDDRTTDICESLDGRIKKDWGSYTPPNHFQCRSILVPVTILDEWDGKESKIPSSVEPLEGFA